MEKIFQWMNKIRNGTRLRLGLKRAAGPFLLVGNAYTIRIFTRKAIRRAIPVE
jgi:hypothetical protein